jgi:hypothetical protein
VKDSYFFFAFFFAFFLVAMFLFSLSIVHGCGPKLKTAIDECIEGLKIEVKRKIDVNFDCRPDGGCWKRRFGSRRAEIFQNKFCRDAKNA